MKGFINVRITPINDQKIRQELDHDYRKKKNIKHVDHLRSVNNYQSHDEDQAMDLIEKIKEDHKDLYLKRYKRRIRPQYTHSVAMGVITFPAHYQDYYNDGKITKDQLLDLFDDFVKRYRRELGGEIVSTVWHFDEKTFHGHFFATNYNVETGETINAKSLKTGETLQEIGGAAFAPIGLKRGISKRETNAKNGNRREHYNKILNQADTIEHYLSQPELKKSTLDALINGATKPLKTMLTYVRRALKDGEEASKIIQNQERALNKIKSALPNVQGIDNFDDLIDYIITNKKQLNAHSFAPRRK